MQRLRPERRPRSPSAGLLVAAFAAATLLFLDAAAAQDAEVKIDNFTFAPPSLTVKAGTTVTWRNEDDIPHTVASSVRVFKSTALDTDDSFSFTFTEPGSYDYFCSMHPHMRGKIVVEPGTHAANPHSRGLRGGPRRTRTCKQAVMIPLWSWGCRGPFLRDHDMCSNWQTSSARPS